MCDSLATQILTFALVLILSEFYCLAFLWTKTFLYMFPLFPGYVRYDKMPTFGSQKSLESKCEYRYKLHLITFHCYAVFWLCRKMMQSKKIKLFLWQLLVDYFTLLFQKIMVEKYSVKKFPSVIVIHRRGTFQELS